MGKKIYMRNGSTSFGEIIANIDEDTGDIRTGSTSFGSIIGRYDKKTGRVRMGDSVLGIGQVGFNIDSGGYIRGGDNPWDKITAHITHESGKTLLRAGDTSFGDILANFTEF